MRYLIGVDEAGRGPLAGPVAVGAVLIPPDFDWAEIPGVRDSKQLGAEARERIYAVMETLERRGRLRYAVRFSSAEAIDRFGITRAVRRALICALEALGGDPGACSVLLDGSLAAPPEYVRQHTIIRGDETEPVISLASIAAKVARDRRMERLAQRYPAWGFEAHKGYGTLEHRLRIRAHGFSPQHRRTFCTRIAAGAGSSAG